MFRSPIALVAAAIATFGVATGAAQALNFEFPARCSIGIDCLVQYQPGGYVGLAGTDIRPIAGSDLNVLSIEAGVVLASRDGAPDLVEDMSVSGRYQKSGTNPLLTRIAQGVDTGRDAVGSAGNAVMVDHGVDRNGRRWVSTYAHMSNGSVAVKVGDKIVKGQMLGRAGRSGRADFTHVNVLVHRDGVAVDPFTSASFSFNGSASWAGAVVATPSLINAGFAPGRPDSRVARAGGYQKVNWSGAEGVSMWAEIANLRIGDVVTIRLTDANGAERLLDRYTISEESPVLFRGSGVRFKGDHVQGRTGWTGTLSVSRSGAEIMRVARAVDPV